LLDITRNMFYWFRGPAFGKDPASHRQLENNLTKSLITILEHCDRDVVLKAFLKLLGLSQCQGLVFSLQRKPLLTGTSKKRVVLGITGGDAELAPSSCETEDGRPDAWICGSGWTVLIESKIGRTITRRQLKAHAHAAGWSAGSYRVDFLSWNDLHNLAKRALTEIRKNDRASRLLLRDWLAYLEYQNMADFEKLEAGDFDFFTLPPEERRALLPRIRQRVRTFAHLLSRSAVIKRITALYEGSSVEDWKYGDLTAKSLSYWFNIGGHQSVRTWHLTVFFRHHGIDVEVLASQAGLSRRLCKSGADHLRALFDMTARTEGLHIGCRRGWYRDPGSSYKGQHIAKVDEPVMLQPAVLSKVSREFSAIVLKDAIESGKDAKEFRAELIVRQHIGRDEIISGRPKDQVALVRQAAKNAYPVLKYLLENARG